MRPIFRALSASTVLVVGYTAAFVLVSIPLVVIFGENGEGLMSALAIPLDLPFVFYRTFLPYEGAAELGRVPIEHLFIFNVSTSGANIFIYYIPIRLFLQWREQKSKLP